MSNGRLGAQDLLAGVPQAIYVCNSDQATVLTLNIVNRSNVPTKIRVAISTSATAPSNTDWIEYDTELLPKGVLERSGLIISPNMYLIVVSDTSPCNAVCWGVETGNSSVYGNNITTNPGSAPTWVSPAAGSLGTIQNNTTTDSIQLRATDPYNPTVKYSVTAGALPGGTTLDPNTGLLSASLLDSSNTYYSPSGQSASFTVSASNGPNSSTRAFSIIRRWADGSSQAYSAPSAEYIKGLTGTNVNGNYWIKPQGSPNAGEQVFCIMDNSIGDYGGWMCAFNLVSTSNSGLISGAADWYNSDFWDSMTPMNVGSQLTSNHKTSVYMAPVRKVNFLLHNISNSSFRAWGAYNLTTAGRGMSLYNLCSGGPGVANNDNVVVSAGRWYYGGSGSGSVLNPNRPQTAYGDIFTDASTNSANLYFRAKGQWGSDGGSANNMTRIATTLGNGNSSYGHTFAGIGGTHQNSGWRCDFTMAPVSPYCQNPQSYGDRTDGVNCTSYSGWSYPYATSCTDFTSGPGQLNYGYAVMIK